MLRSGLSLALALLLVPPPCLGAAKPYGGESPQAVVARLKAAAERKDVGEVMACLDPDSRREMAMMMVAGVGMMVAFAGMGAEAAGDTVEGEAEELDGGEPEPGEEAQAAAASGRSAQAEAAALMTRFQGILDRHQLTAAMNDDARVPEDPEARRVALARMLAGTDEIALIGDLMALMEEIGGAEGMKSSPVDLGPEVTDYRVEGSRASAKAGAETVTFLEVDGRWYVEPRGKGQAPAAP